MRRFTAPPALAAASFCAVLYSLGLTAPALAKDGRNAAFVGGAAAGVVGGVLLNQALQNNARAAEPVYVEPAEPRYARPAPVAYDSERNRMRRLREACYDGSRKSCIRFGMILGQNRERERHWRRSEPDFFAFERE
jgi:hypothetical protein